MTYRKFFLANLILLPLGLGLAGVAVAGSSQLAIPQGVLKVAENGQNNGKDAETRMASRTKGTSNRMKAPRTKAMSSPATMARTKEAPTPNTKTKGKRTAKTEPD